MTFNVSNGNSRLGWTGEIRARGCRFTWRAPLLSTCHTRHYASFHSFLPPPRHTPFASRSLVVSYSRTLIHIASTSDYVPQPRTNDLARSVLRSFSSRPVRFGLALPCTLENKENARPYVIREDADSDSGDGQVLYRDDYDDEKSESLR